MRSVFRKEVKYKLPLLTASSLQKRLDRVMERDRNGENGRYFIRSQYYDSIYDGDLWDNLDGIYEKRKIRLRIYSFHDERVKLEYKCKNGQDGIKYSMDIKKKEALQMEQGDVSFLLNYDNELALRLYMRMTEGVYRPKSMVDYQRLAFVYPAGDVRITFDTDIRGSICSTGLYQDVGTVAMSSSELVLMEVKYTGILPDMFNSILREADHLAVSNSKYSTARMFCI